MPPPTPATILKAVILPPSRHHRPPPPFIYVKKRRTPSVDAPARIAGDARKLLNRINTAGSALILVKPPGCARTRGWWMRSVSSGGAGRWAGKLGGRAAATGSVQQLRSAGGVEGGYGRKDEEEEEQDGRPPPGLVTLPTVLTLARVAAVPLLVSTFYTNASWATTATTTIFVAAAITDWLDGYIARKMQLRTTFGAFLDPVADKLMVAATLVLLCTKPLDVAMYGEVPWLLTVPSIAIIGREITMSAVREWAASQDTKLLEAVAVNNLGKWKTATQMTALTLLLATRDSSLSGPIFLVPAGVGLLYISAGLAVWSLTVYMKKIWRILLK